MKDSLVVVDKLSTVACTRVLSSKDGNILHAYDLG